MELVRWARNPWGEEILIGLNWSTLWLIVIPATLFVLGHAFFARKKGGAHAEVKVAPEVAASIPEKVVRHNLVARVTHWILAASVLTLLVTAFVPILGLKFPWLTIHWVAGIVLTIYVVFHTIDTLVRLSWGSMMVWPSDIMSAIRRVRDFLSGKATEEKVGKWGFENKAFHHATALAGLLVVATGVLMMARIDTWFWASNPYVFDWADSDWGLIFVLHGASAVAFVGLLIAHIYFAVRPDNWWITRSMFKGWITRGEFLEHHDPEAWKVAGKGKKGAAASQALPGES
jgi:formate dehydrogenase subunit gamma